jgi:TldD protein
VQPEEIARITVEAVQVAKANASLMNKPVVLAPVPAYTDYWQTPHQRDPFEVPIQEKLELIRSAAAEARKSQQVFSAGCTLAFRKEDNGTARRSGRPSPTRSMFRR